MEKTLNRVSKSKSRTTNRCLQKNPFTTEDLAILERLLSEETSHLYKYKLEENVNEEMVSLLSDTIKLIKSKLSEVKECLNN